MCWEATICVQLKTRDGIAKKVSVTVTQENKKTKTLKNLQM